MAIVTVIGIVLGVTVIEIAIARGGALETAEGETGIAGPLDARLVDDVAAGRAPPLDAVVAAPAAPRAVAAARRAVADAAPVRLAAGPGRRDVHGIDTIDTEDETSMD